MDQRIAAELSELIADPARVLSAPAVLDRLSHDFYWYSPILRGKLAAKRCDVAVQTIDVEEVLAVLRFAGRHEIPVTARGAGTGNYGQCVPLEGGIVLDLSLMDKLEEITPDGVAVCQPGLRLAVLETEARKAGWELRMYPSTLAKASVGGFLGGGSGGIGSITYGGLIDPGNVLGARVVTVEDEPRVLELQGDAAQAVNHAYGTTGIITAVEIALAPVWPWFDLVVAVDAFPAALRIGHRAALADGIVKKLLTPLEWPIPGYFRHFNRGEFPAGRSCLIAMVAEPSLAPFEALVAAEGGEITYCVPLAEGPGARPLYECTWNHTTLHALKIDRTITYLQARYPADRVLETVAEIGALFGDELMAHLEVIRGGGRVTVSGLHLIRYTTPERLDEIFDLHEARGVVIANPHVYTLEDGTRYKRAVAADQSAFKRHADPYGLLNPGKMRSFTPVGR